MAGMLLVALVAFAASAAPPRGSSVASFREADPSESRCTLELSRPQFRYTCAGRRPLSGSVRLGGVIRLVGVSDEMLSEQWAAASAAAQARVADPRVLIRLPEPLELSPELRVAGAEGRIYLVPPISFAAFCAALGSPPSATLESTPSSRRGHWFVLEGAAPAWLPTPLACPPELTNVPDQSAPLPR